MNCPLCFSNETNILESISRKEIIRLWLEFDVNVYNEIKTAFVNKYHCNKCGLSFFDPQNAGADKFYSKLGEFDWYYLHPGKTEYKYVQAWIKENDFVLDIGSGSGELYNNTSKKINYTGLELSTKAVQIANEKGINVINEDLLVHAKNNSGKYDIVVLFQVLEHLIELEKFIGAIKECLKPGAYLCVAVPNNDGFLNQVSNNAFNLPPHHTLHWNKESLEYLGKTFGLNIVEVHFEKLQDVHKEWFLSSLLTNKLLRIFRRKHRTLNYSTGYNFASEFVRRIQKRKWLNKIIKKRVFSKERIGHSIIIVFQKPA